MTLAPRTEGTRQRTRRIWFASGVIALAFTIAVIAFSTLRTSGADNAVPVPPALESASPEDLGIEVPPVVWPRNMAGGGVRYGEDLRPVPSAAPHDDAEPETRDIDREAEPVDILIFVDYRCPACVLFESTNGEVLERVVEQGGATVEFQPLTFLDRIDQNDYYSTRAAAAQACIVDGQPKLAWDTHQLLLHPAFVPPGDQRGHTNEELITAFGGLGVDLHSDVSNCIAEERFVPFASAMNEWVFQHEIPNATDQSLAVQGTPTVLVGGELFSGDPGDAAAFEAFLAEHGAIGE